MARQDENKDFVLSLFPKLLCSMKKRHIFNYNFHLYLILLTCQERLTRKAFI